MVKNRIISISRILVAVFLLLETVFPIFNIRSHETNAACAGLCLFLGIENNEIQQGNKTIRLDNGIFVIDDSPEPISATLTVRSGMYDSPKIYIFGATEQIELIPTTEEIQIPVTIIPELKNGHYSAIISVGADGEYEEGAYFYFISQQITDGLDLTSDGFKLSVGSNAILNNETHAVRKYDHANDIYYYEVESFANLYATYVGLYLCDQDNQCSKEDDGYTYTLNTNGYSSEFSNLDGYRSDTTIQLIPTLDNDFLSNLGYYSVSFSVLRDDNVDIPFWALNRISTLNHQFTKQSQLAFKLKDSTPTEPNYVDKNTINLNSVQLLRNDEEITDENGIYFLDDLQDYNSFIIRFNYDCGEENLYCDGVGSYIVVEPEDRNEDVYYGNNDGDWLGFNPDEMTLNFETGFADYTYTTNLKYKTFEYNTETNQWDIPLSSEILATRTITIRTTIEALLNAGLLREQFNIVSVSQGGEALERKYDETNDLYYYETPKSGAKVQVEVGVNFLKDGHIYAIDSNGTKQQFTSEDNGNSKIVEISPYFSSNDQYSDIGYQRMDLSFYKDDYEEWFSINLDKQVFLKPTSIASDKIEIISISQNGEELEYSNGRYEVPVYSDPISLTYKLSGLEVGKKYESHVYVDGYNGQTEPFTADSTEKNLTEQITLNNIRKQNNISIDAYEINYYGEGNYNQWLSIPTEIVDPNFVELGTIIVDSVKQNGVEIIPTLTGEYDWEKEYTFELNDIEDYEVSFHVDQAMDDLEYQIDFDLDFTNQDKRITASGNELKNGVTFSNKPIYNDSEKRQLYIGAFQNDGTIGLEYEYNGVKAIYFEFIEDETLPRFDVGFKYSDGSNIETWGISPKYHNENKPLVLSLSGEHYNNNEDYNVSIKIRKAGQEIYSKNLSLTGSELNNGKNVVLDNFLMTLPELDEVISYAEGDNHRVYYFDVTIGNYSQLTGRMTGYNGLIKTATIHENGEFNAIGSSGGGGEPNLRFQGMSLSSTAFNQNKSITMYYITEDYDEKKQYTYELYYYGQELSTADAQSVLGSENKVSEGTISGEKLNNGVLNFNLRNNLDYSEPMFILILKENEKIADIVVTQYTLWNGAGVYSVLPKGTKDLYIGQAESWYISPKENDINIKLTGVNFEDNKQYTVEAYINGSKDGSSWPQCFDEDIVKTKQIKGSSLNAGVNAVEIKYDEVKNCDDAYVDIRVTDSDQNRYRGTGIDISFQDINNYFETENGITINNGKSRIKSIITSVNNLIQKNKIINDGIIKIFKNGEEFVGDVGTGMVARIFDKFGRAIVDLDMVIQGDVNGDGIMGIIDYIKVKKDIMDIEGLDSGSLFFEAADMNENNNIDIIDYIKIKKGIMEKE